MKSISQVLADKKPKAGLEIEIGKPKSMESGDDSSDTGMSDGESGPSAELVSIMGDFEKASTPEEKASALQAFIECCKE